MIATVASIGTDFLARLRAQDDARRKAQDLKDASALDAQSRAARKRAEEEAAVWRPKREKARLAAERKREEANAAEADLARIERDAAAAIGTHDVAAARARAQAEGLLRPWLAPHVSRLLDAADALRTRGASATTLEDGQIRTDARAIRRRLAALRDVLRTLNSDSLELLPDPAAAVAALEAQLPPIVEEVLTRAEYAGLHRPGGAA
jgi:hypothetical protein